MAEKPRKSGEGFFEWMNRFKDLAKEQGGVRKKVMDFLSPDLSGVTCQAATKIKDIDEESAHDVYNAIEEATQFIKVIPEGHLKRKGIKIKPPQFYLELAIKESHLIHTSRSRAGATGPFQITPIAVEEVNSVFGTTYEHADLEYAVAKDDPEFSEKKYKDAIYSGAVVAILYFHTCRDVRMPRYQIHLKAKKDKDQLSKFMYNFGPSRTAKLWRAVDAKNYDDFEKKLSQALAKAAGREGEIVQAEGNSPGYGVKFKTYLKREDRTKLYDKITTGKGKEKKVETVWKPVKVGTSEKVYTYRANVIIDALDYVRVVQSISETISAPSA